MLGISTFTYPNNGCVRGPGGLPFPPLGHKSHMSLDCSATFEHLKQGWSMCFHLRNYPFPSETPDSLWRSIAENRAVLPADITVISFWTSLATMSSTLSQILLSCIACRAMEARFLRATLLARVFRPEDRVTTCVRALLFPLPVTTTCMYIRKWIITHRIKATQYTCACRNGRRVPLSQQP